LRALHYPSNPNPGQYWGAPHTDIDMFTILPRATEEGLQVFLPKKAPKPVDCRTLDPTADEEEEAGEWIPVQVPAGALIINCGDKLQAMTNGYFRSSVHRIVAKPNVERYSMVYFVHPRNEISVAPRPNSLLRNPTPGPEDAEEVHIAAIPKMFPCGVNSHQMLMHRLQELGLCPPEWDSTYAKAVTQLVNHDGVAHPAMVKAFVNWSKMRARAQKLAQDQESSAGNSSELTN
jgi:hypothetical protein